VTGVDFSVGMLDQARRKAAAEGVGNIAFLERDMTASAGMRGGPLGMELFKEFDNGGSR
jgi:hypothetical protein